VVKFSNAISRRFSVKHWVWNANGPPDEAMNDFFVSRSRPCFLITFGCGRRDGQCPLFATITMITEDDDMLNAPRSHGGPLNSGELARSCDCGLMRAPRIGPKDAMPRS